MPTVLSSLFVNYQSVKLDVPQPGLVNALILGVLFLAVLATLRRGAPSSPLGKDATDQAKGLSIFFIMLGHLWLHAAGSGTPSLGEEGVFVFLFLSGFGLTASTEADPRPPGARYLNKRLRRVMVPYWVATVLILLLDWLLLGRTYPWPALLSTFLGFNRTEELKHLDYVRWYITFLLFWYVLFVLARRFLPRALCLPVLLGCAIVGFAVEYYLTDMGWYQFLAFPLGCGLGEARGRLAPRLEGGGRRLLWSGLVLLAAVFLYRGLIEPALAPRIPSILFKGLKEGESLGLCLALLLLFGWLARSGWQSGFLKLLGKYAYELFLLHGAFLIKYNPFFLSSEAIALTIEFWALVLALLLLCFATQRASAKLSALWPG